MRSTPPPRQPSDTKYVFILFGLIFVVLIFAFLVYFIYGQGIGAIKIPADDPTFEDNIDGRPSIEDVRSGQSTLPVTAPTTNTNVTPTTTPTQTATDAPVTFDPSRYNPRTSETMDLHGKELLEKYFSSIQSGDYVTACSLFTNTICNARRDTYSFSQHPKKTNGGYTVKSITLAAEQKPTEAIYCIEYSYTLKAEVPAIPIIEYFQYRIKTRPDGADEISARVCEKIVKDGKERPCPIITPKKYCY